MLEGGPDLSAMKQGQDTVSLRKENDRLRQKVAQLERLRLDAEKSSQLLRQSEELFSTLAWISPVLIFRSDADGKCLYVNERWTTLTGRPVSEALGDKWAQSLHPDDADEVLAEWREASSKSLPFEKTFRFISRDGSARWVEARAVVATGDANEQPGYVGVVVDITEQKKRADDLARIRDRYELSISATRDGVWEWDMLNDELYWSPRLCQILGLDEPEGFRCRSEFINRVHPDDLPRVQQAHHNHRELGAPYDIEYRLRHHDGHYLQVHARGQVERDGTGTPIRMAGAISDITERHQTEQEIERQRLILEAVFNDVPDAMVMSGPDRRIVMCNPGFCTLFGTPPGGTIGTAARDLYADEDEYQQVTKERVTQHEANTTPYIVTYRRSDGTEFPGETIGTPVRDQTGALLGFLAVIRDVTERESAARALRESEARFRDYAEAVADWFWEQDENLRFTYVSSNRSTITGLSTEELIGQTREEFFVSLGGVIDEAWEEHRKTLERREDFQNFVYIQHRADGNDYFTRVSGKALFGEDGAFIGYRGVAADISQQMRREQAMREAKDAAEAANVAKSRFLSTVSHELRTPITSIRAALGLISSGTLGDLSDQAADLIKIGEQNCERLGDLVDDILDLDRIQSGRLQLNLEMINTSDLISEAIDAHTAYCDRFGVTLRCVNSPEPTVQFQGDKARLLQVLGNLISNAAKFSSWGKEIRITAKKSDDRMEISVIDEGSGIPERFRERIFLAFTQADAGDNRRAGGTGLGLAITKHIVEYHQGEISFETEVGKGTTFKISLPLALSTEPPAPGDQR